MKAWLNKFGGAILGLNMLFGAAGCSSVGAIVEEPEAEIPVNFINMGSIEVINDENADCFAVIQSSTTGEVMSDNVVCPEYGHD